MPNLLFILTDDQRFDTIRALGQPHIQTPTLDALAARGTACTHAYIPGGSCPAVCMPSRAMLNTGRSLYRIEAQGQNIPTDHTTMGEAFRAAGYHTYAIGKWHNGRASLARSFCDGDEIFFGGMEDHWNVPAYHFDFSGKYDATCAVVRDPWHTNKVEQRACDHITAGKHSTDLFADAAVRFLERHRGPQPFLCYLAFMAPHDPRSMPRQYLDRYDPERLPLPPNFAGAHPFNNGELHIRDEQLEAWPRTPEAIRRHLAEYYAMISHLDAAIGRVLAALARAGHADDTVIVVTGDNGLALGQHGLMGKQSCYEHSVHVPLLLAGPGVPRGVRRDQFCYLYDLFPTVCDLAGVPVPASVEGRSLAPVLADPAAPGRETLHFAYRHLQRAVRHRQWKLIEYVVEGRRTTQLFDLERDPWETHNLAADAACAAPLAALRRELRCWPDDLGDTQDGQGKAFWAGYGG